MNRFEFEVSFKKQEILDLLNSSEDIKLLLVTAILQLDATGSGQMESEAWGCDFSKHHISDQPVHGCPSKC
jgi:hypothetical protein